MPLGFQGSYLPPFQPISSLLTLTRHFRVVSRTFLLFIDIQHWIDHCERHAFRSFKRHRFRRQAS